jgi:pimeloyl-ACP methyl ester carboxylesterase
LVLLDARHEAFSARRPVEMAAAEAAMQAQQRRVGSLLARTGLIRPLGPLLAPPPVSLPEALHPLFRAHLYQPRFLDAVNAEGASLAISEQQADETGTLGTLPLVVVAHDPQHPMEMPGLSAAVNQRAEQVWQETQRAMTGLSTDNRFIVAEGAGHNIHLEKPELVAEVVYEMLRGDGQ